MNDFSDSDRGGFKEVILNIKGNGAYRRLRFEGGGHRVQRVPETEAQGRIHTAPRQRSLSFRNFPDVKIEIALKDVEEFGCRGVADLVGRTSTKSKPAGESSTSPAAFSSR